MMWSVQAVGSDVLIHEDRVAVGVDDGEAGRAGRLLIGLGRELNTCRPETPLQLAHVRESGHRPGILVPAVVERQDVPVEHALKQPDDVLAIPEYLPVRPVAGKWCEPELLVERP